MTTQQWFHLQASNVIVTPYKSSSPCRSYNYIAIYAEIKNIPLAIKLAESHIFVSYLQPNGEDKTIQEIIQNGENMDAYNKYYFERLLNIVPSRPYQSLLSANVESREKYSYSFRKHGYQDLSEFDLFSLMLYLWATYYGEKAVYPIATKNSQFGLDALLKEQTSKDVSLYEDPYNVKTMIHLTVREMFERMYDKDLQEFLQSLSINPS